MKLVLQKHSKIFLYFLLGIGLPCLLLSYFALRGIQNDRALTEKNTQNEHRRIAEKILKDFKQKINEIEQGCADTLLGSPPKFSLFDSEDSLKTKYPTIEAIFYVSSKRLLHLPIGQLLYLADRSIADNPINRSKSVSDLMTLAQKYEFGDKSYRRALAGYRNAFAQTRDQQVKGEILNAIARVQKRLAHRKSAINSYKKLLEEYKKLQSSSGYPFGLIAGFELGRIHLSEKDTVNAIQTFLTTYRNLVQGQWLLEKSQFEFFQAQLSHSLQTIFSATSSQPSEQSSLNTFNQLLGELWRKKTLTERLLIFQANFNNLLKNGHNQVENERLVNQIAYQFDDHEFLISWPVQMNGRGHTSDKTWGIIWEADSLTNLLSKIINQNFHEEHAFWQIVDRDGEVIRGSKQSSQGDLTARRSFPNKFPHGALELYQPDIKFFEYALSSRRSIYFYIFVLITGILIFGFILAARNVTHELDLAKLKSDFVSTVSHEFKSPLTSIRQLAEMLQTGRVPSTERRQKYYDVIVEQSERLSLIIDNVLDFAKMEEGREQFDFESVDLDALLRDIVTTMQHRLGHEGFELQSKIEKSLPCVKLDRIAIMQAITNLIDNAIKYSDRTKKVLINSFTKNQQVHLSVKDYGIGIKEQDFEKVFERFYRGGDELIRTTKGSGLGLTLVKQIVEAHQGTVHLESELGKGSTFTIKLPIPRTDAKNG